ncbi:MAG TPA: bacteriohemerythrin [Syntrophorhabdaceae bacterium]|nr:bacteriohemerythrin [Syntrophorhabdaceae bacterium]
MALIEWDNSLNVNIAEIDKQHQKLVSMINELNEAMIKRQGKDIVGKIIEGLVSYAGTHFATEEKYFDMYRYPGALSHKKEHADFVKRVGEFQEGFKNGNLALTIEVMRFLKDWLTKHIMGTDKKYGPFFNEKGLR